MSRIGFAYPSYLPHVGGVEKNLYEIAEYLTSKGNHVYVISNVLDGNTSDATGSWYPPALRQHQSSESTEATILRHRIPTSLRGFSFIRRRIGYPLPYSLYKAKEISESARAYELKVLYAVEPALSALIFACALDPRLRTQTRKVGGIRSSFYPSNALEHNFAGKILRRFDAVIVSIFNTRTYNYVNALTSGRAVFIPGWVDTTRFRIRDKLFARQLLGLEKKNQIILSIGRLVAEKGFEDLLKGFAEVSKTSEDASLLMVGAGPLKTTLDHLIKVYDLKESVEVWNPFAFTDQMYPLLFNAADLFVLMPKHDGVSQVALEAMASGIPVAYSDVAGIPQLLRRSFHLIESREPRTVAKAIMSALVNSSRNERATNMGIIQENLSKKTQLPRFIETLLGQDATH